MASAIERPSVKTFVSEVLGRKDYQIIGEIVADGSRVLDLGCGRGELLAWLEAQRGCEARGIEISAERVRKAVAAGLSVYQGDINEGLADYPADTFDYVILSQTLQQTKGPKELLHEMLRVGKNAIIAFPNFGHWSTRLSLLFRGRAPITRHLPYEWFDTPNIHFVTIPDFEELAKKEGFKIEKSYYLSRGRKVMRRPSLTADTAVYLLRK